MSRPVPLALWLGSALLMPAAWVFGAEAKPDPARVEFFESKVRPLLVAQCQGCHGSERQKAGLRLDSRAAVLRGGDSGPAIQPGDPDGSRLIEAVRYDGDVQMPPKRKLAEAEIEVLRRWI